MNFATITNLVVLCLLAVPAWGQTRVNAEHRFRLEGQSPEGFTAGWFRVQPISQSPEGLSPTHQDIMRHTRADSGMRAKYGDSTVTWAHEEVHAINSDASRNIGPGISAYYMLDGRVFALRDCRLDKRTVEQMVPANMRGQNWQLYMTGMNPDYPFVILDEWVAYIASAKVANEMYGGQDSIRKGTVDLGNGSTETTYETIIDRAAALEFAGYATILLQCIERFEPQYPDLEKLREFVAFNIERTMAVQAKPVTVAHQQYFRRFSPNCGPGVVCKTPQPQVRPIQPVVPGAPLVQVPPKPKPQQPACKSCECGDLRAEIAALNVKLTELAARQMVPGPKGDKGEQGPAGPAGVAGKDAVTPDCKSCECKQVSEPAAQSAPALSFEIRRKRK